MKYIALTSGHVIETSTLVYLSGIQSFIEEDDCVYYLELIWANNNHKQTITYTSIDDCEEDYWVINHAIMDKQMICE